MPLRFVAFAASSMSDGKGKGVGVVGKNSGLESESQIPKGSSRESKSSTRRRQSKEPCVSRPTDFPGALNAPRAARASVAVGENLPTGVTSVADPLSLGDGLVSDGVDHSVLDSDDDPLMVVDKETCVCRLAQPWQLLLWDLLSLRLVCP